VGSLQSDIEVRRVSNGLIAVQYRGTPVGSMDFNIGVRMDSGGLIEVQYWSVEGVRWLISVQY
jgi:hypothetical protein